MWRLTAPSCSRNARALLLVLATAWLSACAVSPQTIVVKPDLRLHTMPIGHGRPITVETRDERNDTALGSRGGLYNTATLTTDARMTQSITAEAVSVLQGWDFSAVPSNLGNASMPSFTIEILDIDYRRPESTVAGNVTVKCRLAVRIEMGNDVYTGEYTSQRSEQVPVVGTTAGNQRMVNETINQALTQMFRDNKLQRFLAD